MLRLPIVLCWLLPVALSAGALAPAIAAVLEPATTGGGPAVDRALARLAVHRRMLMIGAHPDDEDNVLMAYVAHELAGEAAYLSLSRGEGGQNLIGDELGEALGVLRTGELVAARKLEGGRQYFARVYDFGYSKSLSETLEAWPRRVLDEDVLRVVRRFKPQIVLSIFPGDGRGRHGQHTAAGVMANELEALAVDVAAFPQLTAEGLAPWRPTALLRRPWWDPQAGDFTVRVGAIDAATGRSVLQLAAASRSRHRSQDMGRLQPLGERRVGVDRVAGPDGAGPDGDDPDGGGPDGDGLFAGIDTRLEAIAELLAGEPGDRLRAELVAVRRMAEAARAALVFRDPSSARSTLVEIASRLRRATSAVERSADPYAAQVRDLLLEKREIAAVGLLAAAGVALDAVADRETLVVGEEAVVDLELWRAGAQAADQAADQAPDQAADGVDLDLDGIELVAAELVTAGGLAAAVADAAQPDAPTALEVSDGVERRRWTLAVGPDAQPTLPYYLASARMGALYDWSAVPPSLRGAPSSSPPVAVRVELEIDGEPLTIEREIVYRTADQARGETRRPLRIVPALEITLTPQRTVVRSVDREPIAVAVGLRSNVERAISGTVELDLPEGWVIDGDRDRDFAIRDPRGRETIELELRPADREPGRYTVGAAATTDEGHFDRSIRVIDYPHVRPMTMPHEALSTVTVVDLTLPALGRVGYVRGAADRVPERLAQVGIAVELLDGPALAELDLSSFDGIVLGPRAYEVEPALAQHQTRLLRYLEGGGLLLVQYQQYGFVEGGYSPLRIAIGRPHGRVTDEGSVVRALDPEHRVFATPNRIGAADWEGWIQERGLYFASEWDPALRPLLALGDPGEEELEGALLVGRYGAGTYVYTGLSFFRQLPAGIPGAFRLFANLLSLAEDDAAGDDPRPEKKPENRPEKRPEKGQRKEGPR